MLKYSSLFILILLTTLLFPEIGLANVEGILINVKNALIGRIMPLFGIFGICYAGFSFFFGNPNAKMHLMYAIIGMIITVASSAIIQMAQGFVR